MTIIRPTTINARFSQPVGLGGEKLWLCPTLGGDRLDLSGNGNHGTYEGGMGTVADKYKGDRAYKFDGSNDRINFGDILDETVWTSGKWTISEWVYPQHSTFNFLLSKYINGQQQQFITAARDVGSGLRANAIVYGDLVAQVWRGFQGDTPLSLNEWYHLCFEYDSSKTANNQVRIFVNGVKQNLNIWASAGTVVNIQNGSESLLINGLLNFNPTFTNPYRFDDVRVYDRHLTPTEIKHLASYRGVLGSPRQPYDPLKRTVVRVPAAVPTATKVGSIKKPTTIIKPSYQAGYARNASESENPKLWDGLVGAWMPSLGVTGETLRDVSGNGNHGTLTNMDAASDWVVKESNQSVEISGGNSEHINISNSLTNSDMKAIGSGDHTIISNVYNLATFEEDIIGSDGIGAGNVLLMLVSSRVRGHVWLSSGVSVVDSHVIGTNKWMQVVQRAKFGETLEVYVDGKRSASTSLPNLPFDKGAGFLIGARYAGYRGTFLGNIGSTFAYNRALTPQEIKQLYVDSLAPFRKKQRVSVAVPAAVAPSATYHPLRSLAHPLEQ